MHQNSEDARDPQVVLVCMPFAPITYPSFALSLLKPALGARGVRARVRYFTFPFAGITGVDLYREIMDQPCHAQLGDWVFAEALFGSAVPPAESYVADILGTPTPHLPFVRVSRAFTRKLLNVRCQTAAFLDGCLDEILTARPRIVGFSTMYQQNVASLALAKRIKAALPEAFIVFGGSNCHGVMGVEMVRQFGFIDAVVSGEGDVVVPELVRRVLDGKSVRGMSGVLTRPAAKTGKPDPDHLYAQHPCNLDSLPYPDYDDYYDQLLASGLRPRVGPFLLMETSRGCWWGDRVRCTFCGFAGGHALHRAKSNRRALDELEYLTARYAHTMVLMTDNLPSASQLRHFFPGLAKRRLGARLDYQLRADITKATVRHLRDAGVVRVQPGIESLSTPVLKLMRKGTTALTNVQFLKWCKEFGLWVYWNLLWGFPAEGAADYAQMAGLTAKLVHLEPPKFAGPVHIYRFSPHFAEPERWGFRNVAPLPAYRYIYPLEPEAVANLAYYFAYDYRAPQDVDAYTRPVADVVSLWHDVHADAELFYVDNGAELLVWDTRAANAASLTVLRGVERALYAACDRIRHVTHLRKIAEEETDRPWSPQDVSALLMSLLDAGLMIREGRRYLSLAIPVGEYAPPSDALERLELHLHNRRAMRSQEALMQRIRLTDVPPTMKVGRCELDEALRCLE